MKNPGVYIGVTVLSDGKDGGKMVASFTGQSYPQGMDDLEVALTEQILINEFGTEFFELIKRVDERMAELGVAVGAAKSDGATTAEAIVKSTKGKA